MFKRTIQRYGDTPEPVTPYQRAAQTWDDRIGSARLQAANWRLMAFGECALCLVLATGNVWQALQSRIVPYVVEVQKEGAVRAVGPALQHYIPQDANIAWYLGEFIKHVRALPIDPVVVRDNWRSAYAFSTDHTKALLSAYARENDPRKLIGHRAVDVQVTSVVRASDTSFEVKWTEQVMDQDQPAKVQHWTAILTYLIQPPGDETTLRINPLGIYVNGINWSREITADPAP